jgi:hypothetical protein
MPFAEQDLLFENFVRIAESKSSEFALRLYEKMKSTFEFTIEYTDECRLYSNMPGGKSARFIHSGLKGFSVRIDVDNETPGSVILARVALPNCAKYMHIINNMPEHIKEKFRCSDCAGCKGHDCPACMAYEFEGTEYRQCHFITVSLDCAENAELIFTLLCAEYLK